MAQSVSSVEVSAQRCSRGLLGVPKCVNTGATSSDWRERSNKREMSMPFAIVIREVVIAIVGSGGYVGPRFQGKVMDDGA